MTWPVQDTTLIGVRVIFCLNLDPLIAKSFERSSGAFLLLKWLSRNLFFKNKTKIPVPLLYLTLNKYRTTLKERSCQRCI